MESWIKTPLYSIEGNKHYVSRYIKFIESCYFSNGDYTEKHHILPKCIFPQFKEHQENIVTLTGRQHFICHYMLAKAFGGKLWFAFNQMKRLGHKGVLYEISRKYISSQIKKSNTGIKRNAEFSEELSKRFTGKVTVKDKNGNKFFISKNDERYKSGELKFHRVGTKHSLHTKKKMSINSGVKGKIAFHKNDVVIFLEKGESIPEGYTKGLPKGSHSKVSEALSRKIWVTEKETNKILRIDENLFDSSVYFRGRKGFKGFKHINESRKSKRPGVN